MVVLKAIIHQHPERMGQDCPVPSRRYVVTAPLVPHFPAYQLVPQAIEVDYNTPHITKL